MNPFLLGFNAPRLIEYIQRLQGSISDKKNSPESRAKFREELVEAHDALRVILGKMLTDGASYWRMQVGLNVKILGSGEQGVISNQFDQPKNNVFVRSIVMENGIPRSGMAHGYLPEELEIVLPVRLWDVPH